MALWRHLVVDLHINIRVTFARVSWGQKLDGYTSHVDRARRSQHGGSQHGNSRSIVIGHVATLCLRSRVAALGAQHSSRQDMS